MGSFKGMPAPLEIISPVVGSIPTIPTYANTPPHVAIPHPPASSAQQIDHFFHIATTPHCVLKTRRLRDDKKVFLNILGVSNVSHGSSICPPEANEEYGEVDVYNSYILRSSPSFKESIDGAYLSIDVALGATLVNQAVQLDATDALFVDILKSISSRLHEEFSLDFSMPKTKNCYKGDHPPTYVGINKSKKHAIEDFLTTTTFHEFDNLRNGKQEMELSLSGELWTITNNMVKGRTWKKKDFEIKDGVIRYLSHNKMKKNYDLYHCSVHECTGGDFEIKIPEGSFAFEIISSPELEEPWKMELCANSGSEREKWVDVIKNVSLAISGSRST